MVDRLDDLLTKPPQPVPSLLGEGAIPVQGRILVGGNVGLGKSLFVMNLIYNLAAGLDFCGLKNPGPATTLYVDQEVGIEAFVERYAKIHASLNNPTATRNIHLESMDFGLELGKRSSVSGWDDLLGKVKPHILVLDPLAQFHSFNENDAGQMGLVMKHLNIIVSKHNCAVILIHHFGKPGEFRSGLNRFRGSSALPAWADTRVEIEAEPAKGWGRLQIRWTIRRGKPIPVQHVQIDPASLVSTLRL